MATKLRALDLVFQGFQCSPIFSVTRSAGYDPDFAFVHVARADLADDNGNIVIEDPPGPAGVMQALQSGAPIAHPGRGKLYACGDLEIRDQDENGKGEQGSISRFLLSENSLSATEATDGAADGLIRIELTDVRKLWDDFGVVFAWINQPARTLAEATSGGATIEKNQSVLMPGTTDGGKGTKWTLRRVLEVYILPNLPGKPRLNRLSPSLEGREVGPHLWDGVRTKLAMQDLLAEADAVPVLEFDNSVSVWKRGDGPLQDVTGKVIERSKKGIEDDRVASRTIRMSHRVTVPDTVVVLGRPIVESRSFNLVAVGEDDKGNLIPLGDALKPIALAVPNIAELLMLPHEIRAAMLTDEGIRRVERWAYKWFAPASLLSGQPNDILPFEDLAETSSIGVRRTPVVMAESITSVRVNRMQAATAGNNKSQSYKGSAFQKLFEPDPAGPGELANLIPAHRDINGPAPNEANTGSLPALGLNTSDTPDQLTFSGGRQGSVVVATDGGPVVVSPDVDSYYIFKNLPMSTQQSGDYEIDRQRGIVKFSTARVRLAKDEVPPLVAQVRPARVKLIVGVSRKPKPTDQLSADYRYSSTWRFKGTRERESLDLKEVSGAANPVIEKVDPKADLIGLSGALVIDTDLQMLKGIDGRTNQAGLDVLAKELAKGRILANRFVPGAVIELVGFVPVIPTGRILSVEFKSNDGRVQTIAHDGQPAPLRAGPKARTLDEVRKNIIPHIDSLTTGALTFFPGRNG